LLKIQIPETLPNLSKSIFGVRVHETIILTALGICIFQRSSSGDGNTQLNLGTYALYIPFSKFNVLAN
jgi:hypothetical protein